MQLSSTRSFAGLALAAILAIVPVRLHADQNCGAGDDAAAAPATLTWLGLPDGDSEIRGGTVALSVRNTSGALADVVVSVVADFGGPRAKTKRYKLRDLPAGASRNLIVDIARLRPPDTMAISGQLLATAEVRPEGACDERACQPLRRNPDGGDPDPDFAAVPTSPVGASFAVAQSIFFHRSATPGLFEIYGANVLGSRYAGGDLGGRSAGALAALSDPNVAVERFKDAGKGLAATKSRLAEQAIEQIADGIVVTPAPADPAPKDGYRLCIRWEVQVTEQGRKVTLPNKTVITEDYWHGYPTVSGNGAFAASVPKNDGKMLVTARGPVVLVSKNGWSHQTIADPVTGCFSFTSPEVGPFTLIVSGEHHDNRGNKTIVRGLSELPAVWLVEVDPPKGKTRLVPVGNFGPNATLAALAAFGMYRSSMGVTNKTIDLRGVDTCGASGGNNSSAHHRFDGLDNGIAYLRLSDGTGDAADGSGPCTTSDHRRAKFLVMHEMGHAWMLLRTKKSEPNVSLSLADVFETTCSFGGTAYTPDSLEFAAVGAREGMAHFYASVVWNNTASANGVFSMWGTGRDIRTFSPKKGGQLWNQCTTSVKCGKTVIMDWARFWWNVHTPAGPNKLTQAQAAAIYEKAILNGGLTPDNYYEKFEAAMEQVIAAPNLRDHFKASAAWQGINTSPSGPDCIGPYNYPECVSNPPEFGAGDVDCPCTDALPLNSNSAYEADTDGLHGDGQGSYAETGSAQYCFGNDVVCGLDRIGGSSLFAPVCQACDEDTMIGCACSNEEQCNNGLDDELLSCFGAPANAWPGSKPGICLPSAGSPQGRDRLVDMPWFCLENCGSKGSNYTCLYDQLAPGIDNDHARCVETSACSAPSGFCEQAGATMCDVEASCANDWQQCCVDECTATDNCTIGFPDFYACSAGACVPPECNGSFSDYCQLYR